MAIKFSAERYPHDFLLAAWAKLFTPSNSPSVMLVWNHLKMPSLRFLSDCASLIVGSSCERIAQSYHSGHDIQKAALSNL
jgi:hypothetical protein